MEEDFSFGIVPMMIKDGKPFFLVVQLLANHWAFPKGHMEENETEVEAAKRELMEEVGIKKCKVIKDVNFTEKFSYKREGKTVEKTVKYFLGITRHPQVVIEESEIKNYIWLPFYQAIKKLTFRQAKQILRKTNVFVKANIDKLV